ncbi:unnamed protein product [Alternaria alternata]
MAPYRRQKRGFGWQYDNYPAFDIAANFGGVGGYGWNSSFDTQYYDLPGTVEQATRSHVEAQNDFEKAKEKYEEAKKKYEECEKKGMSHPYDLHYDSEAETLVGNESDDNDNAHLASANDQPAASHGTAGRPSANEPGEPVQNNIDESIRVQEAKETEDAVGRSLSLIAGARRKRDEGESSLLQ